jgi:hypothetical protein
MIHIPVHVDACMTMAKHGFGLGRPQCMQEVRDALKQHPDCLLAVLTLSDLADNSADPINPATDPFLCDVYIFDPAELQGTEELPGLSGPLHNERWYISAMPLRAKNWFEELRR